VQALHHSYSYISLLVWGHSITVATSIMQRVITEVTIGWHFSYMNCATFWLTNWSKRLVIAKSSPIIVPARQLF